MHWSNLLLTSSTPPSSSAGFTFGGEGSSREGRSAFAGVDLFYFFTLGSWTSRDDDIVVARTRLIGTGLAKLGLAKIYPPNYALATTGLVEIGLAMAMLGTTRFTLPIAFVFTMNLVSDEPYLALGFKGAFMARAIIYISMSQN